MQYPCSKANHLSTTLPKRQQQCLFVPVSCPWVFGRRYRPTYQPKFILVEFQSKLSQNQLYDGQSENERCVISIVFVPFFLDRLSNTLESQHSSKEYVTARCQTLFDAVDT